MISLTIFFSGKRKPNFRSLFLPSGNWVNTILENGLVYMSINEFVLLSYFLLKIPDVSNPLIVLRTVVIRWL